MLATGSSGYRNFYLHPYMRDCFLFRYNGKYYLCIAFPFGWGRSVLWFTRMMGPVVRHIRENLAYRMLRYIDECLLAPAPPGRTAGPVDCPRVCRCLTHLFERSGIVRNSHKSNAGGEEFRSPFGTHRNRGDAGVGQGEEGVP